MQLTRIVRSILLALGLLVIPGIVAATAARADTGLRGPSYSGASAPTGQKPQSKLWVVGSTWFGSLYNTVTGRFEIYRLSSSLNWSTTGVVVDDRDDSSADALWDGTRLYIASATPSSGTRISRYTYDRAASRFTLDSGFPVTVSSGGTEAVVMDKDTTGRLWITYTQGRRVYVSHSTSDDRTWRTPFVLPVGGASNLAGDDISGIVAYNGRIGVMWSNQTDWAMYFASHRDGDPDTTWTSNPAVRATEWADDHLNLKALPSDPAGQVFAATKTSLNGSSDPLILLNVLRSDGSWRRHTFGTVSNNHTRPLVLLDTANRRVYELAAAPCCSGGIVYSKQTSLDSPSFPSGLGTAFLQRSGATINNVTSTKQPLNGTTDLVAIAGDDNTHTYWFNVIDLGPAGGDTTPPETTITSGPSGVTPDTSASFSFSASESGSSFECTLDGSGFAPCSSPKAYSGLAPGGHTFAVRAKDAAGNVDPTPASRSWTISAPSGGPVEPPSTGPPPSGLTFGAAADATVKAGSPSRNFGSAVTLEVDGSPQESSYLRFDVAGVAGTVTSAKLRLRARESTSDGPVVHATAAGWSETGVNWNTRPSRTSAGLDDKGEIESGTWVEWDVTPLVAGNGSYSFELAPTSNDGFAVNSREAAEGRPELILTAAGPLAPPGSAGPAALAPAGGATTLPGTPRARLDRRRPAIRALTVRPRAFAARSGRRRGARTRAGALIRYRLSERAVVHFRVDRISSGRRVGRRCVPATVLNVDRPACRRHRRLKGGFRDRGSRGTNRLRFDGRLARKSLGAGSYRLVAFAVDSSRNRGKAVRVRFRIVAAQRLP